MAMSVDTSTVKHWRSIVTLIVFIAANIFVLFPFDIPIPVPAPAVDFVRRSAVRLRITPSAGHSLDRESGSNCVIFRFPINFITAPLIANLFLLAISAIGRQEVHDGTVGTHGINPLDIMTFFITLAYIAISIDASGLIRWLAFKVLTWGGGAGYRLFFYLYAFFFVLGSFVGNDPIILSGTAFLAYMIRVSENITSPRAWIYTQFAVANIASAILVSSNPTNLVLAGAFKIRFIDYTANMIVPVVATSVLLYPFLLYLLFSDEKLIPSTIKLHQLSEADREKAPMNPNLPHIRRRNEVRCKTASGAQEKSLPLDMIMNPYLDKQSAAVGVIVMASTLITVLTLNATKAGNDEQPVFWVTLPAAFVMFCWDLVLGWLHSPETRQNAKAYQEEAENLAADELRGTAAGTRAAGGQGQFEEEFSAAVLATSSPILIAKNKNIPQSEKLLSLQNPSIEPDRGQSTHETLQPRQDRISLVSVATELYTWLQLTFPTAMTVISHLPFALVPFAFSMFILVQALVSTGWVNVFGYGWYHWSIRTGTVGSIGGMGFLSVVLCNFSGTNIGTSILLCRIIQAWQTVHAAKGTEISNRVFWGTVYSMALGVNYGAFSATFSASLAGLLWRDILAQKHIQVKGREFARVNAPIIALSMAVGCLVLVGEIYITRNRSPYVVE